MKRKSRAEIAYILDKELPLANQFSVAQNYFLHHRAMLHIRKSYFTESTAV